MLAGFEYGKKLLELGFEPHILAWTYPARERQAQFAIVSSLVDLVGPLRIYDLLFKAYDTSVLPRTIDPFVISLYSPKSDFGADLIRRIPSAVDDLLARNVDPLGGSMILIGINDPVSVPPYGIVYVRPERRAGQRMMEQWRRFEHRVQAAA
jgi:hypothetical protein